MWTLLAIVITLLIVGRVLYGWFEASQIHVRITPLVNEQQREAGLKQIMRADFSERRMHARVDVVHGVITTDRH